MTKRNVGRTGTPMTNEQLQKYAPDIQDLILCLRQHDETMTGLARRADNMAKQTVNSWFLGHRAPQDKEVIRRLIVECKKLDINCPVDGLVRIAWEQGNGSRAAIEELMNEGAVPRPIEIQSNRQPIGEAAMKFEYMSYDTLNHFGIAADPFREPDVLSDLFLKDSPSLKSLWSKLQDAIVRKISIVAVIGGVGSGKSTLVYHTLESMRTRMNLNVIPLERADNKNITFDMLVTSVLMHMSSDRKLYANKERRVIEARKELIAISDSGQHSVLVVDEGQLMRDEGLGDVKIFAERMMNGRKATVSIIIVAQPELRDIIKKHSVRQVLARTVVLNFPYLAKAEPFLRQRFKTAGVTPERFDTIIPPDTMAAFESLCRAYSKAHANAACNKKDERSVLTPLACINMFAKGMNYAAKVGEKPLSPLHVDHIQDRD